LGVPDGGRGMRTEAKPSTLVLSRGGGRLGKPGRGPGVPVQNPATGPLAQRLIRHSIRGGDLSALGRVGSFAQPASSPGGLRLAAAVLVRTLHLPWGASAAAIPRACSCPAGARVPPRQRAGHPLPRPSGAAVVGAAYSDLQGSPSSRPSSRPARWASTPREPSSSVSSTGTVRKFIARKCAQPCRPVNARCSSRTLALRYACRPWNSCCGTSAGTATRSPHRGIPEPGRRRGERPHEERPGQPRHRLQRGGERPRPQRLADPGVHSGSRATGR